MNLEQAEKIYSDWKNYIEISDKLGLVFLGASLPPSFLPHTAETITEAINVILENCGEKEGNLIRQNIPFHLEKYWFEVGENGEMIDIDDEKALNDMKKSLDMILSNEKLKKTILIQMKKKQEDWGKD